MKRKAWTLAALVVAAGAAAVAWPGVVDRALPGAGERFAAVRAALPTSVETLLPVYEPPRPPAQAQAPGASDAPRREANAPAGGLAMIAGWLALAATAILPITKA